MTAFRGLDPGHEEGEANNGRSRRERRSMLGPTAGGKRLST
jgi:hypothetical protein